MSQEILMHENEPVIDICLALALEGNQDAQFRMGLCYLRGNGVAQDQAEALRWFQKAAEQGHADAQYHLGMNLWGLNDHVQAAHWWRMASDQGHAKAQARLALAYQSGDGVERDETKAFHLFRTAAEQN